jgi:dienelactone hydrolase
VLFFYDALGWGHQTYTAADMLASLMPDTVVLMPDFFKGQALDLGVFALPEEERKGVVGKWLSTVGDIGTNKTAAEGVIALARDAGFDKVQKWGAFGLCWGGKMTATMSMQGTPLAVAGTGHPG